LPGAKSLGTIKKDIARYQQNLHVAPAVGLVSKAPVARRLTFT
jgi:hypothetical protein